MNIHSLYKPFQSFFRQRRMRAIHEWYHFDADTTIIDVGGSQFNWRLVSVLPRITIVNVSKPADWDDSIENTIFSVGDGTKLEFADKSFDIAYSNSVVEHLGTIEAQRLFANEIQRVGKKIYVQTPAKEFFVEPHLITPFIHWLPLGWQERLMRNFTVWGIVTRPSKEYIRGFLRERRLLSYGEFARLFDGCNIRRETFLCFTKSYIAVSKEFSF